MDAGSHGTDVFEVPQLVVEKQMGLESFQNPALFYAAQKENLVGKNPPALEGVDNRFGAFRAVIIAVRTLTSAWRAAER
jgi:hypothetical protein